MLMFILRRDLVRLLVGAAFTLLLPLILPRDPTVRVWGLVAASLMVPGLVLGRRERDAQAGLAAMESCRKCFLLRVYGLIGPAVLVLVGAWLGCALLWRPTLVLSLWGLLLLILADFLDRQCRSVNVASLVIYVIITAFLTSPLWITIQFIKESSCASVLGWLLALHPVGAIKLSWSIDLAKDPFFSHFTWAAVLDMDWPSWGWAIAFYLVSGCCLIAGCLHWQKRASRCVWD